MTPFDQLIQFLTSLGSNPWVLVKPLFLIGFLLYIAFAVIIVRQVKMMRQTLNGILDLPLKLIALVHLGIAIFIFLIALIIL
jgi:hypothetical protein